MQLSSDQSFRVIKLLEPAFRDESQRGIVLGKAFGDELTAVYPFDTSIGNVSEFTVGLVNRLISRRVRLASGKLAIVGLLETLKQDSEQAIDLEKVTEAIQTADEMALAEEVNHPSTTRVRRHQKRSPLQKGIKRFTRLLHWQIIIAALLIFTIIPAGAILAFATDATVRVQENTGTIKHVLASLSSKTLSEFTQDDFDRLQASVKDLAQSLESAKQQTGILQGFTFVNPDFGAASKAFGGAEQVALAAQNLLEGLQPTFFFLSAGQSQGQENATIQLSVGQRLIELLQVGQQQFIDARGNLSQAQEILASLSLQGVSPELLLQIQQLNQYYDQLKSIDEILINAPDLMSEAFGVDTPQSYLILSQNSDELRPSGGYISTFGWMRVRRFQIADYGYSPTTDSSPNPPPSSMVSDLPIPDWWIKYDKPIYAAFDGSWYADFPSTAKMAAWFYDNGDNPHAPVDGVMSIDIVGFERILEALGSVAVPDYNQVVTPDNFRAVVYQIRADDHEHKAFLAALYKQILSDWQGIDQEHSGVLLNVTLRALQEKHIMLYFKDPRLNTIMDLLGWSGAQTPTTTDYLMVADTNMGNKSNSSVTRTLTYDVQIQQNGSLKSRATISEDYPASVAEKDPAVQPAEYGDQIDYANLMQVFVPKGSTITLTDNIQQKVDIATTDNFADFITLTTTKYDSSERFQFSYNVPPVIEQYGTYKRYRLLLQKQPGTIADAVQVQVLLPVGAKLISTSPDAAASYTLDEPVIEFRTTLITDQWLEVVYQ